MSVTLGSAVVNVALSDADVERIARAVRTQAGDEATAEPWFDVPRAAAYLACKKKRIYDLKSEGRLRYAKEGGRLVFRREWLDAVIELGGENDEPEGLETHATGQ
jgi:excisionase family DNA binding protein